MKTLKYLPKMAENLCFRNSDFKISALSFISEKPIDLNMSSYIDKKSPFLKSTLFGAAR